MRGSFREGVESGSIPLSSDVRNRARHGSGMCHEKISVQLHRDCYVDRSLHPLQLLVRRSMQRSSSSLWREGAPPAGHNGRIIILAAVRLINGRVSKVLKLWWNGALKRNWSMASDAQLARMRGSALRAQGRALTKDGPCRLILMLAMLNYHPSTTWKAKAGSAVTLGRDCMVPRRQSEGC
jgi:hypothetical protein